MLFLTKCVSSFIFCFKTFYVCILMKTMSHPVYHHNVFAATHALGHIKYGYTLLAPINQ